MAAEIKTGDVIFIKGDTKISKWVKVAQYIVYGWKWLCFHLCRRKERRPYNDPRFSHVLISMDKGMFIHAAGGKAVVYTTLDEYISQGLKYKVYRRDNFLKNSDIKTFYDLSTYYQNFIRKSNNGFIGPITPQKLYEYAFHHKHLKMKFELGKNYATNALKRVWYWWLSKEKTKIKFRDDSYCSKFVADLLNSTNDIGFEPDEIIFPAYLELRLSMSADWDEVTEQYETICNDRDSYSNVIHKALEAKKNQEIIQANANWLTEVIYFDLSTLEIKVDNTEDLTTLKSHRSTMIEMLAAKNTLLETRWSDYKTIEKFKEIRTKLNNK